MSFILLRLFLSSVGLLSCNLDPARLSAMLTVSHLTASRMRDGEGQGRQTMVFSTYTGSALAYSWVMASLGVFSPTNGPC